jgi:hypothetical protein
MDASRFGSVVLVLLGLYALKRIASTKRKVAPLPPGPKGIPILGNLADLPPSGSKEWEHWLKHKALYGMIEPDVAGFCI